MPVAVPSPAWNEPKRLTVSDDLARAAGHPLLARLLAARGFLDVALDEVHAFLDPDRRARMDPLVVPGVGEAVDRLRRAVDRREKVLVWGDFDADGQTATAVLVLALRRLGLDPAWHVPERVADSHGLNPSVRRRLEAAGATLLVTCDCGVVDVEPIRALAADGVDTIVTDHHAWSGFATGATHPARAIVSPQPLGRFHPAGHLSGVGSAWALAAALLQSCGLDAEDLLDLVALGTVADVAPMVGENRHLAQRGLPRLNRGERIGISALLASAGRRPIGTCDAGLAGWVLGPRLNAFGRLDTADRAIELLLTEDPRRAVELAGQATRLNADRQRLLDDTVSSGQRWLTAHLDGDFPGLGPDGEPLPLPAGPNRVTDGALVLADPAWHPGIVGLAAGRLAEAYRRPAALASIGADGRARISMRAGVGWADLALGIQAWQADPSLEFRGGGHQGAAGGSVPVDRLERFAESFCRVMDAQRPLEAAAHSVAVDAELGLAELTLGACDAIGRLAPFGPGNLSPTLLVRGVRLVDTRQLGSTGRHLRLNLIDGQGVRATAVWWDASASHLSPGCWLDLLALPERNEFNGTIEVRLSVQGARPAARPTPLLI